MKNKISSQQLGIAGEYYVAAELTRRGHIATITLRNSESVDIICTKADLSKSYSIQVKTSRGNKPSWILNEKSEKHFSENLFYVLVLLDDETDPQYHIVPSKIIANTISTTHSNWLKGIKKNGDARKDSTMRKFDDPDNMYRDRWNLIK